MKNPTPQPPPPVPAPLWAKFTPALAAWCLLQCASTTLAASTLIFSDGFSAYPTGVCFPDGTRFGPWRSVYNGYGCNELRIVNSNHVAQISPLAATQPGRTQAGLITGPSFTGDIQVTMNVYTAKQLRTGSPPNPWEVGWVI